MYILCCPLHRRAALWVSQASLPHAWTKRCLGSSSSTHALRTGGQAIVCLCACVPVCVIKDVWAGGSSLLEITDSAKYSSNAAGRSLYSVGLLLSIAAPTISGLPEETGICSCVGALAWVA